MENITCNLQRLNFFTKGRNKIMTKWFRLISALVVMLVILFNLTSVLSQTQASDYSKSWAHKEISKWLSYGIIQTDESGAFNPSDPIKRVDMAILLSKVFNYVEKSDVEFSDVAADMPFANDVALSAEAGNFIGNAGRFRPNDPITRQEAALVFARAFDIEANPENNLSRFADAGKVASWSKDAVNALVGCGYMAGLPGNIFAPTRNITRAEAVKMIDNIVGDLKNKEGTYTGDVNGNLVVNTDNVILKDMTIHGDLYLTEGIGDGDIKLDNVKITGRTIVKGGGENSIILHNTALTGSLIIIKKDGKVRVVASGNTEIENTILNSGGRLVESNLTGNGFNGVEVIRVAAGQQITLDGDFISLDIQADDVNAEITDGTVGTINVREGTSKTDIVIGNTASVANFVADSEVMVKGGSRIENAQINTDDVILDARPQELDIGEDVSVMVSGVKINNAPKPVETPSDTTPPPKPVKTAKGSLDIGTEIVTIGAYKDLYIKYTPGERFSNGTVIFNLPDGIAATTSDMCYISSDSQLNLDGVENISDGGKTVTIKNLDNIPEFTLWLIDKQMPTEPGNISFSLSGDSDGDRNRKLPSEKVSSSLKLVEYVSDFKGELSPYDGSIRLTWTAPIEAESVEVQYREKPTETEWTTLVETIDKTAEEYYLSGLSPDKEYEISLNVIGGINEGVSNVIAVNTILTPPELTADTFDNNIKNDIELKFDDNADWRGSIYSIHVYHRAGSGADSNINKYYNLDDPEPQFTIQEGKIIINKGVFETGNNYSINVCALGYERSGVDQLIKGPKSDFVLYGYSSNTATFKFSAPDGADSVKIEHSIDGGKTWVEATIDPETLLGCASTSATAIDLASNTSYEFRLEVTGGDWEGISNVVNVTTLIKYIDFAHNNTTSTSATFSFSAPVGANLVKVQHRTDADSNWTDTTLESSLDATSTTAKATGLTPNTAYEFRLVVEGGEYAGSSNSVEIKTLEEPAG